MLTFFFLLQLSLERLGVILHSALFCCPVLTLTPGISLGQAVMLLVAQCGAAQLFLNTISNINFPDNSFNFLWFTFVDSKFEVSLELISFLQKFSPVWIFFSSWVSYQLWFLLFIYIYQSNSNYFLALRNSSKVLVVLPCFFKDMGDCSVCQPLFSLPLTIRRDHRVMGNRF